MHNKEILLVDDRKENLELLSNFLHEKGYKVRSALDGATALMSVAAREPDLILLDVEMPHMDGYEVCRKLKSDPQTETIPIIFISAHEDTEAKIKAFQAGGVDYISKPFANEEVITRVNTHIRLSDYQHNLEKKVQEGLEKLEVTQKEMIVTLSTIMETRDDDTGQHVVRVANYSKLLAELYGLDAERVNLIYKAAPFHDAGKVAIPDDILNKPGKFEPDEWETMKTHAIRGYEIFKASTGEILQMAATIALEHHECWNGSGYPHGLKGEEISIAGRIVILADILDALTTKRVYKEAWSFERASDFIKEQRGLIFEPKIVDLFLENEGLFVSIYNKLKD